MTVPHARSPGGRRQGSEPGLVVASTMASVGFSVISALRGAAASPPSPAPARFPLDALISLDDFEAAAHASLAAAATASPSTTPPGTLEYYASGAAAEVTLARNARAWQSDLALVPRVLVDVAGASTAHRVLGLDVAASFGIAPSAFQRLAHVDGELATSRAAAAHRILYCVSSFATTSLEDVAAAAAGPAPRMMQLYAMQNRAVTRSIVERATRTGAYEAIVLTVDRPVLGRREANARSRFDVPWELHRDPNDLNGAKLEKQGSAAGGAGPSSLYANVSPSLTWADVAWLRSITTLAVVVKGVLSPHDAALAVRAGCVAVWVSNHGGRQLDCSATGVDVLAAVVAAVRAEEGRMDAEGHGTARRQALRPGMDHVEVYVDGGVRRGTDVVKALALGADFVFIGRPVLWGLAVAGEEGVGRVLRTLQDETLNAMQLLGVTAVSQLGRQHLLRLGGEPGTPRDYEAAERWRGHREKVRGRGGHWGERAAAAFVTGVAAGAALAALVALVVARRAAPAY